MDRTSFGFFVIVACVLAGLLAAGGVLRQQLDAQARLDAARISAVEALERKIEAGQQLTEAEVNLLGSQRAPAGPTVVLGPTMVSKTDLALVVQELRTEILAVVPAAVTSDPPFAEAPDWTALSFDLAVVEAELNQAECEIAWRGAELERIGVGVQAVEAFITGVANDPLFVRQRVRDSVVHAK